MHIATLLIVVLLGMWPSQVNGQGRGLSGRQRRAIDSLMSAYRQERRMPALSVAIGRDDALLYASAYGQANIEHAVPATPDTRFRAASTQKALTATAVLQLAASGRLSLDGEIRDYCPSYPAKRWPISVRQLLLHQGGVRGSGSADVLTRDHYPSVTSALERFGGDSLLFQPGTQQLYSNYGFVLLACAIEGVTGRSYADHVEAAILRPTGMRSTGPVNLYRAEPQRSYSYLLRTEQNTSALQGLWTPAHLASSPLDTPFPADQVDPSYAWGAGNYWSTPSDMVRFVMALDAGRVLPDSLRQYASAVQPGPPGGAQRTIGWISQVYGGVPVMQVFGSDWNGSFALVWAPALHLAIAIASNINWDMPSPLVEALLEVMALR